MTADALTPDLPPGTDVDAIGAWENYGTDSRRLCWSPAARLPINLQPLDVRAAVEQQADGKIIEGPRICLAGHDWSVSEARQIARALLEAAEMGERMDGNLEG